MKKLLLILVIFPLLAGAQGRRFFKLEENRVDPWSRDSVLSSYWHLLARGTIKDHLSVFFRISSVNGACTLQLKVMNAGNGIVVARNTPLDLYLDNGRKITLFSAEYQASCRGCGATGYGGSDAPGIMLSYPIPPHHLAQLQYGYVDKIKLYCADGYWFKTISENNSDVFLSQVEMVVNTGVR